MAIEIPPVPSASSALTDGEGRATRPLQSFLNAIRTAFATAITGIATQEEGVAVDAAATALNFVGPILTVTGGAGTSTVTASILPLTLSTNTVEQYNSTTAQAWYLYNTRTSATNYERLGVAWASNILTINAELGSGGGSQRNIALQTVGGSVGIGTTLPLTRLQVGLKVTDDFGDSYDANSVSITHQTPTAAATLNDPKIVLQLNRQGTSGQAYGASAAFALSRYENASVNSRTRLDIGLANSTFVPSSNYIVTLLSAGRVGIGVTAPTAVIHLKAGTATASTGPLKFTAGTNLTTAEIGAVEYDGANFWGTSAGPSRYPFPRTIFTATADKTVGGTGTETTLFGTGVGTLTLPANFFVVGRTIRAQLSGYVSDTGSPTMQVRVKLGSTVIATALSGALIATTTRPFIVDVLLTCRTTGATGAFMAQISERYASSGDSTYSLTTATVAVDTTASQVLDVMLTWGTSDALNTATITNAVVDVLN